MNFIFLEKTSHRIVNYVSHGRIHMYSVPFPKSRGFCFRSTTPNPIWFQIEETDMDEICLTGSPKFLTESMKSSPPFCRARPSLCRQLESRSPIYINIVKSLTPQTCGIYYAVH